MGAKILFFLFFLGCLYSFSGQFINTNSINSEDASLSAVRRLDDYGDNHSGNGDVSVFKKLFNRSNAKARTVNTQSHNSKTIVDSNSTTINPKNHASAFENIEEISMSLIQVINSKKFKTPLTTNDFSGHLAMRDGNIESMRISLPNGVEVVIDYSDLQGNTFQYELNGEEYMGAIFKASGAEQNLYMVTLNGGPLDQTRLKFQSSGDEVNDRLPAEDYIEDQNDLNQEVVETQDIEQKENNNQKEDSSSRFDFS